MEIGDLVFCTRWTADTEENNVVLPIGMIIEPPFAGECLVRWLTAYLDEPIQPCYITHLELLGGVIWK